MDVNGYMEKQIEISERLLDAMRIDFDEKDKFILTLMSTVQSLMAKLEERDEEIENLREEIAAWEEIFEDVEVVEIDEQTDA
jgi:predicted  nucleic acid-binding Zn-ribbon protein